MLILGREPVDLQFSLLEANIADIDKHQRITHIVARHGGINAITLLVHYLSHTYVVLKVYIRKGLYMKQN